MRIRKALGHNKKAKAKKHSNPKPDFTFLDRALVGGEQHKHQFVVEKLIKLKGGKQPKYQVKWKGSDELTWECTSIIQEDAPEAVARFEGIQTKLNEKAKGGASKSTPKPKPKPRTKRKAARK